MICIIFHHILLLCNVVAYQFYQIGPLRERSCSIESADVSIMLLFVPFGKYICYVHLRMQ